MGNRIPCPVPGCNFRAYKRDGLFSHLYNDHLKAEVITALLNLLGSSSS